MFFQSYSVCFDVAKNFVEMRFVYSKELTVGLIGDNGGRAGRLVDQGQLAEVVALVESAHYAFARYHHIDRTTENDVPAGARIALVEHWKAVSGSAERMIRNQYSKQWYLWDNYWLLLIITILLMHFWVHWNDFDI